MRRRKTALEVPATLEGATELLGLYVQGERQTLVIRLAAQVMLDAINQERDAELAKLQQLQSVRFLSLKAWWEVAGREVWKDRRSADVAGAKIGIRLAPPKVKLPRGLKAQDVVDWLRSIRWARAKEFLRVKVEFDKQALIKAHGADEAVRRVFSRKGIGVAQEDEFFIDANLDEEAIRASIEVAE